MYESLEVSQYTDEELIDYSVALALGVAPPSGDQGHGSSAETDDPYDGSAPPEESSRDTVFTLTHQDDLIEEADNFLDRGKHNLAILPYATWVEHWINRIILMRSIGEGTPQELATALIRSCRLELKFGRVWTSLGMPRFDKDLVRRVTRLMEARNGFVHYKWPQHDQDAFDEDGEETKKKAHEAKETVGHLITLEDKVFYGGRTESLKRCIREKCIERQRAARMLEESEEPNS
ncbi:hypothetical protein [Streptomyces globisporus]|uniref:hypothetical protein n=1 Tax=Streptomyces globisporus TaxID=1908 RepID=UPI0037B335E0